jgi:hypothetical protein
MKNFIKCNVAFLERFILISKAECMNRYLKEYFFQKNNFSTHNVSPILSKMKILVTLFHFFLVANNDLGVKL